jgi:hypothetical protein
LLQTETRGPIIQKVRRHPCGLRLLVGARFQVSFTPLVGVLFTFPSRYLCTIGHQGVFRLRGWSPYVQTGFHVPRPTQGPMCVFRLRGYHPLWHTFPGASAEHTQATGLLPFRSPLLGESLLMSFPPATEMFQFTGFASRSYEFRPGSPLGRGCPIRTSADQRSLASPRGFSQRATSFIASWCQGIHRTPFSYLSTTARTQDPAAPPGHNTNHHMSNRTAATPRTLTTHGEVSPAGHNSISPTLLHHEKQQQKTPTPLTGHQRRFSGSAAHTATQAMPRISCPYLEAIGFEPTTPCLQSRCSTN